MSLEQSMIELKDSVDRLISVLLNKAEAPEPAEEKEEKEVKADAPKRTTKKSGSLSERIAETSGTKKPAKPAKKNLAPESDADEGRKVTYDDLAAAITTAVEDEDIGYEAVAALIEEYGAETASDVPEDKWGELVDRIEGLKE